MSLVRDFVSDTLNGAITNVATTATLNSAADFPAPLQSTHVSYYFCGIFDGGTYSSPEAAFVAGDMETVLVTGLSGAVLTIERGFGRTTGVAHGDGDTVVMLADAQNIGESWAINAKSYGALGDGTTDDGVAFKRARDAAMALTIPLFVPQGVYVLTTWTADDSTGSLIISGEGHRSVIRGGDQAADRFIDIQDGHEFIANDVSFELFDVVCNMNDLAGSQNVPLAIAKNCRFNNVNTVFGWRTSKPASSSLVYGEISGCEIVGADKKIVDIIGDVDKFVFRDNIVRDSNATSDNQLFTIGRATQSEQDGWKDILIDGNQFINNTISTAVGTQMILVFGLKCAITNNVIDGLTGSGVVSSSIWSNCRYSNVSGNIINDTASSAVGIRVAGDQRGDTAGVNSYGSVVSSNTIRLSSGVYGIWCDAEETVVTGNYIEDADIGIRLGDAASGGMDQVTISNNVIKRVSAAAGSNGVEIVTMGEGLIVQGNNINGVETGIEIDVAAGNYTTNGSLISGNMITEFSATGIRIDAGTGTSSLDRITISNNSLYTSLGSTTALVTDGGASTNLRRMCIQGNVWSAITLVTYTKQPTFTTYCQHLNDATPNSNIIAEIGTLAVSNVAGTAALHLKETGDHTNTGWKLVTIT